MRIEMKIVHKFLEQTDIWRDTWVVGILRSFFGCFDISLSPQWKLVSNMNLSWTPPPFSIKDTTTKLYSHFSSLQGMCVHTPKIGFGTKVCHTSQIKHETYRKRPTLPAHCLPEQGLESCGREWNNNKGRILLAYLLWCEICLWEHQKILCNNR